MQIVIPMAGTGERFRKAGYSVPKSLIEIDGKPIVAHVLDLFPGESDIVFICNRNDLDRSEYRMEAILRELCPAGRIVGIPEHKLGPVHSVRQAEHAIDPVRPVVVSYCDCACYWDWPHFKRFVRETACAGAIPAYKGFHPYSLSGTNYAYLRESGGWVQDIQEKKPFTSNRMDEFASSGAYYFASGQIMSQAFRTVVERNLHVHGEYYVSLAYKPMFAAGQPVAVYPLQHWISWGTPEDVAEYRGWSRAFRGLLEKPRQAALEAKGSLIVCLAGLGRRFAEEGCRQAKPLIPVSGRPMAVQAVQSLPPAEHRIFVLRADMPGVREIAGEIARLWPRAVVETVPAATEGQACTAMFGLDALERTLGEAPGPITLASGDHGALYDSAALQRLADDPQTDVIVWCARGHAEAVRRPRMFSWIQTDNGRVNAVSVKSPLQSPASDPVVCGTFTFRRADDFRRCVKRMIARNGRINGEFYIESCINDAVKLGLQCRLFEIDSYLSWGTPDELRTFEYWQSCFHKWPGHPYRIENDGAIPAAAVENLIETCRAEVPAPPPALPRGKQPSMER